MALKVAVSQIKLIPIILHILHFLSSISVLTKNLKGKLFSLHIEELILLTQEI